MGSSCCRITAFPFILIFFMRKNRALPFHRIFWMFGTFILACGTTHLMEIWNVWHSDYLLAGVITGNYSSASVAMAVMLIPLIPKVFHCRAGYIWRPRIANWNRKWRNANWQKWLGTSGGHGRII